MVNEFVPESCTDNLNMKMDLRRANTLGVINKSLFLVIGFHLAFSRYGNI